MTTLGFPYFGYCPNNEEHRMEVTNFRHKRFIANKSCDECKKALAKIYVNGRPAAPHYYLCERCNSYFCFNCARTANISRNNASWDHPSVANRRESQPQLNIDRFKMNAIFEGKTEDILSKYLRKICKLMGGTKSMLQFITENAKQEQLKEIHQLLLKQQRKKNHTISIQNNPFNKIPSECTQHVLAYLEHNDVAYFKLSSRRIAIECIRNMRKIPIRTYDSNYILRNDHYFRIMSFLTENRYYGHKTIASLQREWFSKTGIPSDDQLIFYRDKKWKKLDTKQIQQKSLMKHSIGRFKNVNYLILDKNKLAVFDNDKQIKQYDDIKHGKKFDNLLILQYFDIWAQKSKTILFNDVSIDFTHCLF